jgi:hypothetical protein
MAHTQNLFELVEALEVPDEMDRTWFTDSFLQPLGIEPDSRLGELCEDVLLEAVSDGDDAFHMRPGGWRVNLAGGAVKALLVTVVLAAALFFSGADDIPLELLPVVVPLLVDVERVRLSRRDEELLIPLRVASDGVTGMALRHEGLYNRLDPAVREQLNYGDFVDFCERLIKAGYADDAGYGEVRMRPAGHPAWLRVTWR